MLPSWAVAWSEAALLRPLVQPLASGLLRSAIGLALETRREQSRKPSCRI